MAQVPTLLALRSPLACDARETGQEFRLFPREPIGDIPSAQSSRQVRLFNPVQRWFWERRYSAGAPVGGCSRRDALSCMVEIVMKNKTDEEVMADWITTQNIARFQDS
jgi:hypothetical protein